MDDMQRIMSDRFDRLMGQLDGLPDSATTRPATIRAVTPLVGAAQTFIVQTVRLREHGDTVFLEYIGQEGSFRLILPPKVSETIARQRDALSSMVRSKIGKESMRQRMAAGYTPTPPKRKAGKKKR